MASNDNALSARLEDGRRRIDEAEAMDREVAAWESFWRTVLQVLVRMDKKFKALDATEQEAGHE